MYADMASNIHTHIVTARDKFDSNQTNGLPASLT